MRDYGYNRPFGQDYWQPSPPPPPTASPVEFPETHRSHSPISTHPPQTQLYPSPLNLSYTPGSLSVSLADTDPPLVQIPYTPGLADAAFDYPDGILASNDNAFPGVQMDSNIPLDALAGVLLPETQPREPTCSYPITPPPPLAPHAHLSLPEYLYDGYALPTSHTGPSYADGAGNNGRPCDDFWQAQEFRFD